MKSIPVILLKELVIFPNQEIKIELNNQISKKTINEAMVNNDCKVLVVAPIDKTEEEPSVNDLPRVGVIAKIRNKISLNSGNSRITLRGLYRVAINKYYTSKNSEILSSEILNIDLPKFDKTEEKAIRRKLINVLKEYIDSADNISNSVLTTVKDAKDLDHLTDIISSFLPFDVTKKLEYMQNINPLLRAKKLIEDINEEISYIQVDNEIESAVQIKLENSQKDYLLKEKLEVIKKELGETSIVEEEVEQFREKLNKLKINKSIKDKLNHEIDKFSLMNESSPEMSVLRNYLDWVINLPWNKKTKEEQNFNLVESKLNETHYGLEKVKERIVEYLAIKNVNPKMKSPIICLVGPPGVGKTSIAMSIADAMNRKFYKINVGGMNDSTELIGSRRTYLGANPGKIIQGLKKCESKNPVILIDEVDKMVKDYKGDPASTLLEILDPVQNKMFTDNYIEEPFDLSEVLFVLTANNKNDIPLEILDRVELYELNSYTCYEKVKIAKNYLLPRIYKEHNNVDNNYRFTEEILKFIINNYTYESGVRDLERVLTSLVRKLIINNIKTFKEDKIIRLLGNPKFGEESYDLYDKKGVVNCLAVSNKGGIVTQVEAVKYKGNGQIIITGLVEKIMDESVKVATSYIKSNYNHSLNNFDLHIHFLEASLKKDGASAGVAIVTVILSLLENVLIPKDVAFTGEISLNGTILKIGGLKEKIIGAYNHGIRTIYIPKANEIDLEEVPKSIKDELNIVCVSNYTEIYKNLFK